MLVALRYNSASSWGTFKEFSPRQKTGGFGIDQAGWKA